MSKEKTDPKVFIGCYVKRFYSKFEEGNMWVILDARGDCATGDFLYDDGAWRDIEDSVVITDDTNLTIDGDIDGEFPWIAYTTHEQYKGYNPFTKEIIGGEIVEEEEVEKLTLELSPTEARKLLRCLIYPDPKGKDLDYQLELEEIIGQYLDEHE